MRSDRLVLASGSPRRRELLARLGLDFEVVAPDVDETVLAGEDPVHYVVRLAEAKARAASVPDAVVVAADTAVVVDGEILGKPVDVEDGRRMLAMLSGRTHEVLTGVAVRDGSGHLASATESTSVHVAGVDDARSEWYVRTGEGADKAGGYALQGAAALFADRVDGSVSNVIGLPLPLVDRLCAKLGTDLMAFRRNP